MSYDTTPNPPIPSGMAEVSEAEFFARLKADPRDIMPTTENPEITFWKDKSGIVAGVSLPGWKYPGRIKAWAWGVRP